MKALQYLCTFSLCVSAVFCQADEAQKWLDTIRGRVDWFVARDMPPSLYPWDGPELYPLCPGFEPAEFSEIRDKAIDYILDISG